MKQRPDTRRYGRRVAITVETRGGATHVWGSDEEAAHEITRDGTLRIVVFEPRPDGQRHARTAAVYADDEWTGVRSDEAPLHPGRSRLLGHDT